MKIIREYCDRCGVELWRERLIVKEISTVKICFGRFEYQNNKEELCSSCGKEFKKFMSGVSDEEKDTKKVQI